MVWFCGKNCLGKVDLKDMSFKQLKDVLPSDAVVKESIPMKVLLKNGADEILLLYVFRDNFECCHFDERTSARSIFTAKDHFFDCRFD